MSDPSIRTVQLHRWLERIREGDLSAREELLGSFAGRLEKLAHKMFRRFPQVHRWAETDDLLQNSLLRLLRSLRQVQPDSVREFLGLASLQMRRELLDMIRQFYGPHGIGANHHSQAAGSTHSSGTLEPAAETDDPDELGRWQMFHEGVKELPTEEREVVSLVYYHGWTQSEVASLLHVNERTIRRWWESALAKLHRRLNEV